MNPNRTARLLVLAVLALGTMLLLALSLVSCQQITPGPEPVRKIVELPAVKTPAPGYGIYFNQGSAATHLYRRGPPTIRSTPEERSSAPTA